MATAKLVLGESLRVSNPPEETVSFFEVSTIKILDGVMLCLDS